MSVEAKIPDVTMPPREGGQRRTTVIRDVTKEHVMVENAPQTTKPPEQQQLPMSTIGAIEGLALVSSHSRPANGTSGGESGESLEDDQSHLSTSSTKQHSFDTKSMASVTTFAMDEKESIRPDDSASVRAVDDEDGASTISRNPIFSDEPGVIMPALRSATRSGGPPVSIATHRFQTLKNPPRFGDLEAADPATDTLDTAQSSPSTSAPEEVVSRGPVVPASPDERLLDALASPKDRLSILQLEERLLTFLRQSHSEFFDLPPQNSYARLLAHKLADYYGLMHHINEDGTSIRIFRANLTLPTPLTLLAKSIPVGSAQAANIATVKIMRRSGLPGRQASLADSTAASSSVPSKTTSEAGHSEEGIISPNEGTPSRDKSKMTREEREAQYKAARERIFGDFQELSVSENVSTGENSASMSRSSSSSGKKKNRRQKTPKDDTFEARSAFVPSYAPMAGVNIPMGYQSTQYLDSSMQQFYDANNGYYGGSVNYGTTPTQYQPGFDPQATSPLGYAQEQNFSAYDWNSMQQQSGYNGFGQAPIRSGYANVGNMPQLNNHYTQSAQQPHQQQNAWSGQQMSPSFQQMNAPTNTGVWPAYPSSGYQQMPPQSMQNMHVSGGMNRSLFNPQTRSFVPNNTNARANSRGGSRKKNTIPGLNPNHARSNTAVKPVGNGYSNPLPMAPKSRETSHGSSPDISEESLQQKYGAPATLPKKPPPSQVPAQFDHPGLGSVRNPNAPSVGI
jgi:hypothetical protein